jgi:hypothetical protein
LPSARRPHSAERGPGDLPGPLPSSFRIVDPAAADGRTKKLLDDVERTFGSTPNLFRAATASSITLEAMFRMFQIVGSGSIGKGVGCVNSVITDLQGNPARPANGVSRRETRFGG